MATSSNQYITREEYKQQKALDDARKAGKLPAQQDEEGNDINPHMPQYIIQVPWYLNQKKNTMKHHKFFKKDSNAGIDEWYARGQKGFQSTKYRKGACENCGAMSHITKDCVERPRKIGAKFSGQDIQADEIVLNLDLNYDGKRDRWNGYDPETYKQVIQEYEEYEDQNRKRLKTNNQDENDQYKRDQFQKADNNVQLQIDPKTKTSSHDLRIREDTAKYLYNRDVNSAFFDPKSRSMRENPLSHLPPEQQVFKGENYNRLSGEVIKFLEQERFAWNRVDQQNADLNSVGIPSMTEKVYNQIKENENAIKQQHMQKIIDIYGGEEYLKGRQELIKIYNQNSQLEQDQNDDFLYKSKELTVDTKAKANTFKKSKYPEDIFINNHTSTWGSWWNEELGWGYHCCHSNDKFSICQKESGYKLAIIRELESRKKKEYQIKQIEENESNITNQDSPSKLNEDFPVPAPKMIQKNKN